jgi:hypothetical protein
MTQKEIQHLMSQRNQRKERYKCVQCLQTQKVLKRQIVQFDAILPYGKTTQEVVVSEFVCSMSWIMKPTLVGVPVLAEVGGEVVEGGDVGG